MNWRHFAETPLQSKGRPGGNDALHCSQINRQERQERKEKS